MGGVGSLSVWVSAAERKWGGVRGETKAASGSPLGTKPFLKARQAGWLAGPTAARDTGRGRLRRGA